MWLQVHELAMFGRNWMLEFIFVVFAKLGEFGHQSKGMRPGVNLCEDGTAQIHQIIDIFEMVSRQLGHLGEH